MKKQILPKRKHIRLKEYDYNESGYYFVTICSYKKKNIFSKIVGRGLAPADEEFFVELSNYGKIAKQQLLELQNRYDNVEIDNYCIMPNHIHVIIILNETAGASPLPTLNDVICTYKSITTRIINKNERVVGRKVFQTSFYEHIIRNDEDLYNTREYIDNNPIKWETDKYFI